MTSIRKVYISKSVKNRNYYFQLYIQFQKLLLPAIYSEKFLIILAFNRESKTKKTV